MAAEHTGKVDMNFQQLRTVQEAIRKKFNLTEAADVLCTSQSGVSRQIRELEEELGIEIFERYGKRLIGLTPPGRDVAQIINRLLIEKENLKGAADDHFGVVSGQLTIATTHAVARYLLPPLLADFSSRHPQVKVALHQASPGHVAQLLRDGVVDLGFVNEQLVRQSPPDLALFEAFSWSHSLVVPDGHPLLTEKNLTLDKIVEYPIITYDSSMAGRQQIDGFFNDQGLALNVVLTALDSDIIKAYVEVGLGVGIIATMAYDANRDKGLVCLDDAKLSLPNVAFLATRRGAFMRRYTVDFIQSVLPQVPHQKILEDIEKGFRSGTL